MTRCTNCRKELEDHQVKDGLCARCLRQRWKHELTWLGWLVAVGVFALASVAQLWKQVAH
jgi:hypothetical protein